LGLVEEPHLKFTEALAALTLLASPAMAPSLMAQQPPVARPPLVAQNAWVRVTPGADMAAAYLTLRNVSSSAVTVTGVESPIAGHAMIHETTVQGGQSKMRPHEQLVVAPGMTVKFEPGGLHVMLHDLKQPLTVGQTVPLVITLADGGTLQVTAAVRPLSAE
jgi:periplasmic copper chaperone A